VGVDHLAKDFIFGNLSDFGVLGFIRISETILELEQNNAPKKNSKNKNGNGGISASKTSYGKPPINCADISMQQNISRLCWG
jgi:hypothetical protein